MILLISVNRSLVHLSSYWESLPSLIQRTPSEVMDLDWSLWPLVCFSWLLGQHLDSTLVMLSTLLETSLPDSSQPWHSGGQMFSRKLHATIVQLACCNRSSEFVLCSLSQSGSYSSLDWNHLQASESVYYLVPNYLRTIIIYTQWRQ